MGGLCLEVRARENALMQLQQELRAEFLDIWKFDDVGSRLWGLHKGAFWKFLKAENQPNNTRMATPAQTV